MTEMQDSEMVVNQADRDAAADFEERVMEKPESAAWIRGAQCDDTKLVQAFARHRLQSEQAVREENARLTRELAAVPCQTKGAEDLEPGCCAPCRARRALAPDSQTESGHG